MDKMTLKQLRYFEALAKHGHFGRASEASSISQPALSMQIKDLEETLGTALFERSARHVRLTSFGEEIAERVRDILRSVDELGTLARGSATNLAGRLRIGVIPTIAPYLLPQIIGKLTHQHPHVDLHIRETQTPRLLQDLKAGKLDAAILALPISEPTFTEVPLFSEEFVLVRPKEDAQKPVPNGNGLRQMRLLLLEEGHCFRDQALAFCNLRTGLPRDGFDGSSLSTLVQMVGAGIGVTLIPDMAIEVETGAAEVAVSRFSQPKPTRTIGMIWRKTNPIASQLNQVCDIVQQAADTKRKTAQ